MAIVVRNVEDSHKLTVKRGLAALGPRVSAQLCRWESGARGRLVPDVRMVQRLGKPLDLALACVGDVGMDGGDRLRSLAKAGGDLGLLTLKLAHAGLHGGLIEAVLDGGDHAGDGLLDLRERRRVCVGLNAPLTVQFIDVAPRGSDTIKAHRSQMASGRRPHRWLAEPAR